MTPCHRISAALCSVALVPALLATPLTLTDPDQLLTAQVETTPDGRLVVSLERQGQPILLASPVGITVNQIDLGEGVTLKQPDLESVYDSFPWRGVKNWVTTHRNIYRIPVTHTSSGTTWTLEVALAADGFAYRYQVPGTTERQVAGESSAWQFPAGSIAWYQTNTANYEGDYQSARLEDLPKGIAGQETQIGLPVTVELPGGGYALLTEASLYRYSGLTVQPINAGLLRSSFLDDPQGWAMHGPIFSPWRVVLAAADLNDLANSDFLFSLAEPPDRQLFPDGLQTSWIQPGKALITWAVFGNDGAQWHRQKWFVDMCAAMNCEYLLVDGGWRSERWGFLRDGGDLWGRLTELCDYARGKGVGIFVWHAYPEGRDDGPGLTTPQKREAFVRQCREAGVVGIKVDFFDSESQQTIEVYEELLELTAHHQLMIDFHGANKPTGEIRTWPHEITREGIREQEYLLWDQLPLQHYAALPFTRMVVGFGDFLPTYVRPKYLKNTSAVFQLATAVIFTSPFICWPDHPEAYLESPFLSLVRNMPAVWDETRVLPESKIGEFVCMARRSGSDWYLAVLNCRPAETSADIVFDFLGDGDYTATFYQEDEELSRTGFSINAGQTLGAKTILRLDLPSGGGLVGQFRKPPVYTQ